MLYIWPLIWFWYILFPVPKIEMQTCAVFPMKLLYAYLSHGNPLALDKVVVLPNRGDGNPNIDISTLSWVGLP